MTFELWTLLAASLLGLIHLSAASFMFKAQVGNAYTVGARDEAVQPTRMAGRMQRAQLNFLETFPLFAACVVTVHLAGASAGLSYWGCFIYIAGRTLYLPLYALGVPWLRTFSWNIATLGVVLVGVQVFFSS
jgi:uncharacterized MAPEG superfamily protein